MHSQIYIPHANAWTPVEKARGILDAMPEDERMQLPVRTVFPGSMGGGLRAESIDEKKHTADFVISTEKPVVDSYWGPPTSLAASGMRSYNSDDEDLGPVLFMHEHCWVAGRTVKDWVQGKKNLSRCEFDVEDELGSWLFGKVQRRFIRMASVGYRKLKWYDVAENETDKATGLKGPLRRVTEWERLEWSVVAVGANPDAVGRGLSGLGMSPAAVARVFSSFLAGQEAVPVRSLKLARPHGFRLSRAPAKGLRLERH